MSCPDWSTLARLRESDAACEPDGWREALEHSAVCGDCRRAAIAFDPLLVFSLAAASSARSGDIGGLGENERESIRSMQDSVLALVRASRVASSSGTVTSAGTALRRNGFRIAAGLALLSTLALFDGSRDPRSGDLQLSAGAVVQSGAELASWIDATAFAADSALPSVEGLDRLEARIYELPQEGLAVVMIVDSSLDV